MLRWGPGKRLSPMATITCGFTQVPCPNRSPECHHCDLCRTGEVTASAWFQCGVRLPVLVGGAAGHAAHVGGQGHLLDDGVVAAALLRQRQLLCDLAHACQLPWSSSRGTCPSPATHPAAVSLLAPVLLSPNQLPAPHVPNWLPCLLLFSPAEVDLGKSLFPGSALCPCPVAAATSLGMGSCGHQ